MTERRTFSGGMASVLHPEMCPPEQATLIHNMRIEEGGAWVAVPSLEEVGSNVFSGIIRAYEWKPTSLPSDIKPGDSSVLICFSTTTCYAFYRIVSGGQTTWKSLALKSGVSGSTVMADSDSTQVLFVDGRDNLGAHRIQVDRDGAIGCAPLGMEAPSEAPQIAKVEVDPTSSGEHTLLPLGVSLYYCYCVVNKFGERSNPSPVTVYDRHHRFIKGEYIVNDYEYSESHTGEITSILVKCTIDQPDLTERVELYRSYTEYTENREGMPEMTLIRSVETNGLAQITISDTVPASAMPVDQENDSAPAGDDIAISGGIVIIGNAVSKTTFRGTPAKAWRITLTNNNSSNYSNQWIRLVLNDEATHALLPGRPYLEGLSAWPSTADNYRFLDSDRTTTLAAFRYPNNAVIYNMTLSPPSAHTGKGMFLIQIPYIPAMMTKDIYLVEQVDAKVIDEMPTEYFKIANPVRNANVIYAEDCSPSLDETCNYFPRSRNRANAFWDFSDGNSEPTIDLIHYDGYNLMKLPGRIGTSSFGSEPVFNSSIKIEQDRSIADGGILCIGIQTETDSPAFRPNQVMQLCSYASGISGASIWDNEENLSCLKIMYYRKDNKAYCIAKLYNRKKHDEFIKTYVLATATLEADMQWGRQAWLYLSWGKAYNDGSGTKTPLCAAIVQSQLDSRGLPKRPVFSHSTTVVPGFTNDSYYLRDRPNLALAVATTNPKRPGELMSSPGQLTYDTANLGTPYEGSLTILVTGIYAELGSYIDNPYEIYAMHLWEPVFPTEAIGWRAESEDVGGIRYPVNSNVTIEKLNLTTDQRPGRIRWSRGGAVPELNERSIADEVVRITAMKSWIPAIEHNTILAFTRAGNIVRILMDDDRAIPITELTDMHLPNRDSLAVTPAGLVWSDGKEIYLYTPSGLKPIAMYRVPAGTYKIVANPSDNELLFIPQSGTKILVYSLDKDLWTRRDYGHIPQRCMVIDGKLNVISSTGKLMREHASNKLPAQITTGGIPARTRLRRITLRGNTGETYTIKARIHHHRDQGTGYSDTPLYQGKANTPMAIPNLCGDLVQFDITGLTTMKYIEIEDSNGN